MLPTIALVGLLPLIQATPSLEPPPVVVREDDTAATGTSCTVTDYPGVESAKASCNDIVLDNLNVPAGVTLDLRGLKNGTSIAFKGKTVFGFKKWEGPLVAVSGFQIAISGAPGHVIDCDGGRWWDGQGNAGGMLKPRAFDVQSLNSSTIKNLNVVNTPVQFMNISGSDGLRISNVTMDNSAGDSLDASLRVKRGRNTDGFDIRTSNNVFISDASVTNQDSCFLVTSGTNINLVRGRCTSGRGVSIGTGSLSTSDDNIIKSVTVRDTEITGSEIGLSILAATGATGSISGVMFSDITMTNITKYGILIEQDWDVKNGNGTGNATTGVPITDLTLSQVNGTVVLDATDVYVFCGDGSCSSWTWDRVHVTGGIRSDKCSHLPPGVSC